MIQIAKTDLTLQLEKSIWEATRKMGTFCCFEVTIGLNKRHAERVDYITYNTKGIWRCYEIKVSKADFHSKAKKTFLGHYNYYVMPKELYDKVKDEIPKNIGVYTGSECIKRAKKQELQVNEQILKDSMIRSLYREYEKQIRSKDRNIIDNYNRRISQLQRDCDNYRKQYINYSNAIFDICETYNLDYKEVRQIVRK